MVPNVDMARKMVSVGHRDVAHEGPDVAHEGPAEGGCRTGSASRRVAARSG